MRRLLLPLTPLYRLGIALRERRLRTGAEPVLRLQWPVISIGNISTGGTGKTPLTIALAKALTHRGLSVDVLSRGYGRQSNQPAQVDPHGSAEIYGDEPLLIAQQAEIPVYVAPQRFIAGQLAESASQTPGIHLLDDGFQHRQLHRDIDILLITRADLADRLLPAGNLREPIRSIQRVTHFAIPAEDADLASILQRHNPQATIWRIRRQMNTPQITGPVTAFCGIARPTQFFQGLEANGLHLTHRIAFPDHHRYTTADLSRLQALSQTTTLLTTDKDRVRLGSSATSLNLQTASLTTILDNESAIIDALLQILP